MVASLTHYVFRSIWTVEAPPEDAFAVLRDVSSYPRWWPEVKEATQVDRERFDLQVRSFLPYALEFTLAATRADRAAGVLEAKLTGDLDGVTRWTIAEATNGSRLVFHEDVVTTKRWLNALAPLARPAFKANHAVMMRHGQAGLRTFLADRPRGLGAR